MSYDTDHVQNVGESPEVVTCIPTLVELLDNPKLAALYTAIRHDNTTGPELIDATSVSKKTVYDYLHKQLHRNPPVETGRGRYWNSH